MTRVHIADSNEIIREGLKSMLLRIAGVSISGESGSGVVLSQMLKTGKEIPDLIIIDYNCDGFKVEDLVGLNAHRHQVKVLAITGSAEKEIIRNALRAGVDGHLLNCCDFKELSEAIEALTTGNKFYCGKLLSAISEEEMDGDESVSCDPVSLSEREMEIIRYIADGLTNKEIAELLSLSAFTVMTHRKNLMAKLRVNNTAGIVIYAVKENMISPNRYLFAKEKQEK